MEAFAQVRRYLGWTNYALVLILLGWCALTRAGSRLMSWLMSWLPGPWPLRTALGAASITLATTIMTLPIAWWQHARALQVGLSTQSATEWFRDLALSWLVDAGTTAVVLVLVVGFARRWPQRWPLPLAAAVAAATLALSMAYPLLIEPWLPLSFALNSLNRTMGQADVYPFILSARVIEKLGFIHTIVHAPAAREGR